MKQVSEDVASYKLEMGSGDGNGAGDGGKTDTREVGLLKYGG